MLKQLALLCLLGSASELLWVSTWAIGPFRENTGVFLSLMLAQFGLLLWSFFRVRIRSREAVLVMLFFALLFRLTALPAAPHESEDVYRYIWDARVSSHGINPYAFAPDSTRLESLRDPVVYPMLNSRTYISVYPPVSQILFRIAHTFFGENVTGMKALFSLLEFGSLLLAWRLLTAFGLRLEPLFLLAWNPFFILEFSSSGHSDSAMMFFVLLSIHLLHRSQKLPGMAVYACAVLSKLHPALWFPFYLRRAGWKAGAAGLATGAILAALYFTPGGALRYFRSLSHYYNLFEFNAGVHYLLRWLGRVFYDEAWDQLTGPYLAAALLVISVLLWWKFPVRNERDLIHAGFWLMTADVCLSTTVHPWYLSWAALALPFFPYAFMVYWTGASLLSYVAYAYRPVFEPTWVLLVEYLPMYALMCWEIGRKKPLLASWLERRGG